MELVLLVLRAVVGVYFFGHGTQKLFGWFGGYGLAGTGGFFESLNLRPGRTHALLGGLAETTGGILVALGLFTPVGALLITAVMTTAVATVHWTKGPWQSNGGYELNLVYSAAVFALAGVGPGTWSLDHALSIDMAGTDWALAALVVGVIGGLGAVLAGRARARRAERTPPAATA